MAVANEASIAMAVKTPRTELIAAGWENVAPFRMTAWKQPIWVLVELEKIRKVAEPSKSGMDRAIFGMPETSDCETGMMASAKIGIEAFSGHRLFLLGISEEKGTECGRTLAC